MLASLLAIGALFVFPKNLAATDYTATVSGNWDNPTIWSPAGPPPPGNAGTITINSGVIVTIPNNSPVNITAAVTLNISATGGLFFAGGQSTMTLSNTSSKVILQNLCTMSFNGSASASRVYVGTYGYTEAELVAYMSDGTANVLTAAGPLPIELKSFEAEARFGSTELNWETASECNVSRFEVERSTDGRAFQKIGEVAASVGCTAVERKYDFMDRSPASGTNYYRLRTVDEDGSESFSPIRSVQSGRRPGGITALPNITAGAFSIQNNEREDALFSIRDLAGRLVESGTVYAGTTIDLSANDWHSGIYLLIFEKGNSVETARLVKI